MPIAPLQIPQSNINNTVDPSMWGTLANLGNVYRDAQTESAKQAALAGLGNDPNANAQVLLRSGVPSLAQIGLNMQQRAIEQRREDSRYAVADAHWQKEYAIQSAAARRAQETYDESDRDRAASGDLIKRLFGGNAAPSAAPAGPAPFPAPLPGAPAGAPGAPVAPPVPFSPAMPPNAPTAPAAAPGTPPAAPVAPVAPSGMPDLAMQSGLVGPMPSAPDPASRVTSNLLSSQPASAAGVSGEEIAALYQNTLTRPLAQALIQKKLDPGSWTYQTIGGKLVAMNANDPRKNFVVADVPQMEVKEIENNGVKSLVRVNKQGPEGPIAGSGPTAPANPLVAPGKSMNHDEAQAATYTDRMAKAHEVINQFEKINQGVVAPFTGTVLEASKGLPSAVQPLRNWFLSGDRQQFDQSKRDFVNAILRKESGAAISPSEFANAEQQYFPQPGDSEETLAQKQQNRLTAMQGMAREAGNSYRPPAGIVPIERRPAPASAEEAYAEARNDLANRVPRDKVEARLKSFGLDPARIDQGQTKTAQPKTITRTGFVNNGPNKGKTIIVYSDGTHEYQ